MCSRTTLKLLPFAAGLLLHCAGGPSGPGGPRRGSLREDSAGNRIMVLRGSHARRGYQHGSLVPEGILSVIRDMLIGHLLRGERRVCDSVRQFAVEHFVYDSRIREEAGGVIRGIRDAGFALYDSTLERELDSVDILILASLEELFNATSLNFTCEGLSYCIEDGPYGCSSLSSWGASTREDPELNGGLVLSRHWDYPRFEPMIENLLIVVHIPAEKDEQPWVSGCWAGRIGSCTAINHSGVGAFLNYGPENKGGNPDTSLHRPVSLSLRAAIERSDYNGDNAHSVADVMAAFSEYRSFFGCIVHAVSGAARDTPAVIIETDNASGIAFRTHEDNTLVTGENLVATNHFRTLSTPLPCTRYDAAVDSFAQSPVVSFERSRRMLAGAGGYVDCIYSITWSPRSGKIRWSTTTVEDARPAYERTSSVFRTKDLFGR